MGFTELRGFLQRHRRIALDASVLTYQIDDNPRYAALAETVFEWLELPNHSALTSTITMMELLVQPYRDSNEERVHRFYALLSHTLIWTGLRLLSRSQTSPRVFARGVA